MNTTIDENVVWKALADPVRREILDVLSKEPRTTGQLVDHFEQLSRTGVMKHLGLLEEAGLVIVERSGRTRWNHINPVPIQRVCQRWLDVHAKRRASSVLRLKKIVESIPQ